MKPNLVNKLWEQFQARPCTGVTTTNCQSQYETIKYESVFKISLEFADITALNLYLLTAMEILRDAGGEITHFVFAPAENEIITQVNSLRRVLSIRYKHTKEEKADK